MTSARDWYSRRRLIGRKVPTAMDTLIASPCPLASPSPYAPAHEIRVPIDTDTAQLLDALSAVWHCSYRDVLARCVEHAARGQAPHTRLLRVILDGR